MATVKKSNKKKIIIIVIIAVVVVAAAIAALFIAQYYNREEVTLTTISTDDIYETVSSTGTVESGSVMEYTVSAVATVKEVFVEVGDEVEEGDTLATFDTSTLDTEVAELEATYEEAKESYYDSVEAQEDAEDELEAVNSELASLEKQLAKLQASASTTTTTKKSTTTTKKATTTTTTTKKATTTTTTTTTTETTTADDSTTETTTTNIVEEISELVDALNELVDVINETATTTAEAQATLEATLAAITAELESGDYSAESISAAVTEALEEANIDEEISAAVVSAIESIDWESVVSEIENADSTQIATLEIQIASLTAQAELYEIQASDSTVSAKKELMDTAKSALETVEEARDSLSAGWVAAFDGTITECSLVAGSTTSALSSGLTLENMDSMVVTVSLNEYDTQKVKVGMEVTVTTAYGTYSGEVISKAPTATGGDTSSILDSLGSSIAGISGLSSLTSSGAGVEATVRIDDPDEYIIVGFDADVEISTGDYLGVVVVPIESISLEKTGTYVYLYDEEEGSVTKTLIETGAVSDSYYEVTDGLSVGDRIIETPSSDYEEDTFDVRVVE